MILRLGRAVFKQLSGLGLGLGLGFVFGARGGFYSRQCVYALKMLVLSAESHPGGLMTPAGHRTLQVTQAGSCLLRSTLATTPVLFARVATAAEKALLLFLRIAKASHECLAWFDAFIDNFVAFFACCCTGRCLFVHYILLVFITAVLLE